MKSGYLLLLLAALGLFCPGHAQNWSPPVAVTTGDGDDHHFIMNASKSRVAWDRTEGGNTDVYAADFNPISGQLENVVRLTSNPSIDEKPELLCGAVFDEGLFFQSNASGQFAIYYAAYADSGYSRPWMTLYSDESIYDPQAALIAVCLAVPTLLCHNDSSAFYFADYPDQILPDSAFYCPVENVAPANFADGYWIGYYGSWINLLRWAWEIKIDGRWEIGYAWGGGWPPVSYTGYVPNGGFDYHNLWVGGDDLYFDRESELNCDIVKSTFSLELGTWSLPQVVVPNQGNERHWNGGAFELDWLGSWDIGYWHASFTEPEIIDSDPADDLNPVMWQCGNLLHVFWESNRDGSWKIYHSQRDIVGVEPHSPPRLPGDFEVSVHPNPGNAKFRIRLDMPVSGMVTAEVYDLSGRRVAQIHDGSMAPGIQTFNWNATGNPSGIYLLRVESGTVVEIQKIVLLR